MSDAIIIYYSRAGNNYVNGVIKNLPVGNTEIAAKTISEITGAELFKIEQENPYSDDYSECIEEASSTSRGVFAPSLKRIQKISTDTKRYISAIPTTGERRRSRYFLCLNAAIFQARL